jgi:hypothetical protein
MTKPKIQIGDLVREMTDEEYETYLSEQELDRVIEEQRQAYIEAKRIAKDSALVKLAALGLAQDEIEALLGLNADPLQNS